jgi:hypothetical protein
MSCAFSDYSKYALYSVNVTALAGRLQAEALPVHGRNIALLIIPEMPTYWRFGLSGMPTFQGSDASFFLSFSLSFLLIQSHKYVLLTEILSSRNL